MVTRAQKEETVKELKDKFAKATAIYSTDQNALTVEEISNLRRELRPISAEFKIAKNKLFNIAAKGTQYEALTDSLVSTTAMLFCYGDTVGPAGVVKRFSKSAAERRSLS